MNYDPNPRIGRQLAGQMFGKLHAALRKVYKDDGRWECWSETRGLDGDRPDDQFTARNALGYAQVGIRLERKYYLMIAGKALDRLVDTQTDVGRWIRPEGADQPVLNECFPTADAVGALAFGYLHHDDPTASPYFSRYREYREAAIKGATWLIRGPVRDYDHPLEGAMSYGIYNYVGSIIYALGNTCGLIDPASEPDQTRIRARVGMEKGVVEGARFLCRHMRFEDNADAGTWIWWPGKPISKMSYHELCIRGLCSALPYVSGELSAQISGRLRSATEYMVLRQDKSGSMIHEEGNAYVGVAGLMGLSMIYKAAKDIGSLPDTSRPAPLPDPDRVASLLFSLLYGISARANFRNLWDRTQVMRGLGWYMWGLDE